MRRPSGTALLTVMLATVVMFTMLGALLVVAHGRAGATRVYAQQQAGQCLADAAIARVQNEMAKNADFAPSSLTDSVEGMEGTYTVKFSPGPFAAGQSCNNLKGTGPKDGPRGSQTVPANSVDLCVQVQVGGTTRNLEVLLWRPPAILPSYGLTASGHIRLRGNVSIDGSPTLGGAPVPAGIQSQVSDNQQAGIISWRPMQAGDHASISGNVSVGSTNPNSIDFGANPNAYSIGGTKLGVAAGALPIAPIKDMIESNKGASAPVVNPLGTTVLTQPVSYFPGDLNVNGDLSLSGATLYVHGYLHVNGSISGTGAVYVGSDTRFKGDSSVSANNSEGVALYSQGSVQLSGFDGTQYLDTVASSDAEAAALYSQIQAGLAQFNAASDNPLVIASVATQLTGGGELDRLSARLANSPPSRARDFLIHKIQTLSAMWSGAHSALLAGQGISDPVAQVDPGSLTGGEKNPPRLGAGEDPAASPTPNPRAPAADSGTYLQGTVGGLKVNPQAPPPPQLPALTRMSLDELGTSYFQGIVHTHGYLYASNEVSIVGSIWTQDDGTQTGSTTPSGEPILPGDLYLDNGVKLSLNQQSVTGQGPPLAEKLAPMLTLWLEP